MSVVMPSRPVKRIEMVLHQDIIEELTKKLDALGASGYTLIQDVLGRGERGLRSGVGLGAFQYSYLLLVCEEAQVEPIIEMAQPYLKRFGGLCLVSDAQWVIH